MQRSILSFFSKLSDSNESKTGGVGPFCDPQNVKPSSEGLADANVVDDVNENWSPIKRPKRRRLILDSSEDESDDLPCVPSTSQEKSVAVVYSCPNRSFAKNLTNSPKSSSSLKKKSLASEKKEARETINDLFDTSTTNSSFTMNPLDGNKSGVWPHLAYDFLQPSRIKDACGRQPSHPDYDPRTLFVPDDFLRKQSPALRQWWILKSQNFDTLLFFKMGKFYELYHMDAVIAVDELKLSYMRGEFAHSGFPEIAFQRMADRLLHRGYKVARVEQTETPENMVKRTSGRPGADKVVRREICQVITPGTWFAPLRNGISSDSSTDTSFATLSHPISQPEMETDLSFNRYLLVLLEGHSGKRSETLFGVALLKAATGEIMIGQFSDDIHYSQLCTTIAHFPPSQILFERGNLTTKVRRMLKARLPNVPFEGLAAGKQFLSARETICMLESANYFALTADQHLSIRGTSSSLHPSKADCWPADLLRMLDPADALGRSTLPEYELAVRCLGAVVFYLRYCLTDTEILSLGLIREYRPQKVATVCGSSRPFYERQVNMVLDSITLDNLEVLTSNFNDTLEGTLLGRLDACCTSFGRRLLRFWVVNPPCQPKVIIERQEAIQELMELNSKLQGIRDVLRRLPDLERLLTKVHIMGWNGTRPDHPESRAIVVDEITYSKRKIMDFLVTLGGFKSAIQIIKEFSRFGVKSEPLRSLTSLCENGGSFPDYSEQLNLFDKAFDHEKAKRDGCIAVEPGFDSEFDKACEDLKRAEQVMEDFLAEQSDLLGCQLSYTGTGKNRFQLEVPEAYMSRVPHFWEATGQRKGFRRFRPPAIMELFTRVVNAEDAKHASMHGIMRRLFASFSSSYSNWQAAIKCIAELDCLLSLANYSLSAAAVTCRPEFYSLAPGIRPFLEIVDGLHPCLTRSFGGGDITPNDVRLGHIPDQEEVVSTGFKAGVTTLLITGPNMGGKSTLMRQTALLAILAHLGCHIPARSCRLTPIDRVFTRIGASDRLISGQSTFYVELAEAAVIINQATAHSLVLMDELGRGTSTRDGSALASAVIRHLTTARPSGPLTLFSTHYHGLVETLQKCQAAASLDALDIGHMACLIGNEMTEEQSGDDDLENSLQRITFLYKLVPSACPKSYGFNVAHLAQVPNEIINKGAIMAREFEKAMLVFSCLRDILSRKVDRNQARRWLSRLGDLSRKKMYGPKQEK